MRMLLEIINVLVAESLIKDKLPPYDFKLCANFEENISVIPNNNEELSHMVE